ncbi:steroid hormone receptor ERR1 isoform X1 [Anoplophora glabripennis]|uniref:steroid hormone receptor ERR1 isoform X1 n=2 Tax=Anoplophora glabripennis TaxID=217634 RepID=UPI0008758F2F|nr:steroid hormone receptor ERR1 isoform X1 [Anoplophora glabripennis]
MCLVRNLFVMDCWMEDMVSMMTDTNVAGVVSTGCLPHIKKELDGFSECSPSNSDMYSPTTTVMNEPIIRSSEVKLDYHDTSYERKLRSPSSPERQYCSSTTQPHTDSGMGHIEGEMKEEDSPRRLCLVCGDVASGFHYGVASCEACKAFFKRTIQGNIEYTCPASGECEINKRRRKACQACRFRKCLRSGMLKEGVRLDRVRGGRQKYRRNPESPYQVQVVTARPMLLLEDIKMLEALAACEPDCLEINTTLENSKHRTLSILSDLYDKELVGIIGWAKQIPGFTDLSLNDQMRLLQSTWAEILTLTLAFRSLPLMSLGRLKFATDFTLDEKQSRDCGAIELYQTCCHVVDRLDSLSILKEEYYLLKALILTNSDVRLDEYQSLKKFRDTILSALSDAIGILRPTGVVSQIQQLLLCMPALRQADHIVRRFWSDVHQQDLVPMNKLFLEMLEAYCR